MNNNNITQQNLNLIKQGLQLNELAQRHFNLGNYTESINLKSDANFILSGFDDDLINQVATIYGLKSEASQ